MKNKTVLVTGANGYVGNAVAKAFVRGGWTTYGLIRKEKDALDLKKNEIFPVIGTPEDLTFLNAVENVVFDCVISNTEDWNSPETHLEKVEIMLYEVSKRSIAAGIRPLIMFSSGCKDYGRMQEVHGDENLAGHTEISPINPPAALVKRAELGIKLLEDKTSGFDSIVLRPTIVYGNSSSHYGTLFNLAAESKSTLTLIANPNAIMHSLHIDDCADAYLALAEHPIREEVAHQAYNISNIRYETAEEVGRALGKSYHLKLDLVAPEEEMQLDLSVHSLANFSQWVNSSKIRKLTGWKEKRIPFTDGIEQYRMAYEALSQAR
ncbi:MAG: NAD(P)-dependent oxidoreductase [Pedobacter sp.]|nr:MAG: NAD(P)-dependent oxidoreductase [Pedobacter sp.]